MSSDVDVCNIAQTYLGAEALNAISGSGLSVNEKRYGRIYATVRDAELRKRRWNFSREFHELTPTGTPIDTGTQVLNRFNMPGGALRPIRESGSRWQVVGRQLLSEDDTLKVWFICSKPASDFDPLFSMMLAAKLAELLCEAITQSNEKKKFCQEQYELTRREAALANAFEIGPEAIAADDAAFSWVASRYA